MRPRIPRKLAALLAGLTVIGLLGGCTYDYLQRTDRVAFHAGDAVEANLARETDDPSRSSMRDVSGLGKNGHVIPSAE